MLPSFCLVKEITLVQEIKGNRAARWIKLLFGLLMMIGIVVVYLNLEVGISMLIVGFFGFVIGRFMD